MGPDEITDQLWSSPASDSPDSEAGRAYTEVVLQQYLAYVGTAERVSDRRGSANMQFITLNTTLAAAAAASSSFLASHLNTVTSVVVLVFVLAECAAWFLLLRSYRLLNAGKFQVIHALEQRLPARMLVAAEWSALGSGRDPKKYLPLGTVEQGVPVIFGVMFVLLYVAITLG